MSLMASSGIEKSKLSALGVAFHEMGEELLLPQPEPSFIEDGCGSSNEIFTVEQSVNVIATGAKELQQRCSCRLEMKRQTWVCLCEALAMRPLGSGSFRASQLY